MKRLIVLCVAAFCANFSAFAQYEVPEGYELVDSVVYVTVSIVDTTLIGDIRTVMPSNVSVHQSGQIDRLMADQKLRNESKTVKGYRIRIFFDNKQDSRSASEATVRQFNMLYPGVPAQRTFSSPFFKVTVGEYRNKADATSALNRIKQNFPAAFVVKDKFRYPSIGGHYEYRADTIKVLRPTAPQEI